MKKHVIASTILLTVLLCGCSTKTASGPINSADDGNHTEETTNQTDITNMPEITDTTDGQTTGQTEVQTVDTTTQTTERPVYEIGDLVEYGTYEQDGDESNGEEPIVWRVIDKDGNNYLLLSEKIIDIVQFKHSEGNSAWTYSTLRDSLDKYFSFDHLQDDKRFSLKKVEIENKGSEEYFKEVNRGVPDMPNTEDKIFLLSLEEVEGSYFSNTPGREEDSSRVAYATEYVKNKVKEIAESGKTVDSEIGGQLDIDGAFHWWLRTPGVQDDTTLGVLPTGELRYYGSRMEYGGLRPALWAYANSY